ncbi:MAG TPA: carbonic anhydrase family protein [Candidatus Dormibacteraeota bacterium]|nr:carbonic anhydrase family protein [Candidatus Dormibacteraeota bacterium]
MQPSQLNDGKGRLDRRAFCKAVGVGTTFGIAGASMGNLPEYVDLTKEQRDKLTPDGIIQQMKAGNERFRTGKPQHRDLMREAKMTAKGQYPAAIVFGCVDSRAPAELILDYGIGDIFSGRVAGNIADEDIMGSMEFACKVTGSKVVLVMGHTACGAIKGAIDDVKLGNLTALLAKIRPAVEATQYTGERTAKNYAFVDAVARKNVELTIAKIREQSPVLRELESSGSIKIAGSMYNLETGVVDFF